MAETARLGLPLLAAAQSQKHVTVNEALTRLDAAVPLAVLDRTRTTPPIDAAEGDRHIVAANPGAAWSGQAGTIAWRLDGAWRFITPAPGHMALVLAESAVVVHDGSGWRDLAGVLGALQNLTLLGIGTTADAANPLAAKLNAVLLSARGAGEGGTGDLRATLNKEAPSNVLSVLFQTAFAGRAEFGLIGSDDLTFKVAAGGAWIEALRLSQTTGRASFADLALPSHSKAALPDPAPAGRLIFVSDAAGGAVPAFSDGTQWRRLSDRSAID